MMPIRRTRWSGKVVAGFVLALLGAAGCERRAATPSGGTTAAAPPAAAPDSTAASTSAWDPSFGLGLLVPTTSPMIALGVSPDSETLGLDAGTAVTLISRSGVVSSSAIGAPADDADGCAGLPAWRLAGPSQRPWSLGFVGGDARPLPLDSLGSLSRSDSARVTTLATRMASALPSAGFERFVGLPFITESVWRVRLADADPATDVIAVSLVRKLNIEAQPLQERTFLVIEQRVGAEPTLAHSARSQGSEEKIETRDVLGAVRLGSSGAVMLVVAHDFGDAVEYSLLERSASGSWHVRWTSDRVSC